MNEIENAFDAIMQSACFRLDGPEIDLPEALTTLALAVHNNETDESTWSLGESLDCDLGSLLIGAYWALSEWHGGQASPEYAALCAIGQVFSPGWTAGPEADSSETTAYETCNEWFQNRYPSTATA